MDNWDPAKKIRVYDCPRCEKHHRIISRKIGTFVCECGMDLPPHSASNYIKLGKYCVKFVGILPSYTGQDIKDHTLISWTETLSKSMYDIDATIENAQKAFPGINRGHQSIVNSASCLAYAKANPVFITKDVSEVKSITLPGFKYKITLEDIQKLMLLV